MAQGRSGWLLRPREGERRISYLELFLDLGLIVALSRLSQRMVDDLSSANVVETAVLLAAIWWVWTVTAYTTDWYDPRQPLVQFVVLAVMLGGLLMSVASVRAYEDPEGIVFAGSYVGPHLLRGVVLVTALRGHELRRRPLRVLIWFGLSGVLWLTGAFLPASARLGCRGGAASSRECTATRAAAVNGVELPGLRRRGGRAGAHGVYAAEEEGRRGDRGRTDEGSRRLLGREMTVPVRTAPGAATVDRGRTGHLGHGADRRTAGPVPPDHAGPVAARSVRLAGGQFGRAPAAGLRASVRLA